MTKLPQDEIIARLEAALYSAGRPLTIDELTKASGIDSKEKIKKILNELINKTKVVFKAIKGQSCHRVETVGRQELYV